MRITQIIRSKLIIFLLMLFSFIVPVGTVCAKTLYVSDQLIITLREGMGNEYKIIKTLKTGTPLEVIEEGENYLKVRIEGGIEGWVLRQYVTGATPKAEIISGLEKQMDRLNTELEQYKIDKGSLQNELKTIKSDYEKKLSGLSKNVSAGKGQAEQTARELKEISGKYNALVKDSKDVIDLAKERDSLKVSNSTLKTDIDQLQEKNKDLRRSQMIWWFVAGGGVFFVGWLSGKTSRQKRFY